LLTRKYEPGETAFFSRLLSRGDHIADIGANIGYYTTLFAEIVGPAGKVIAFEPDPRSEAILRSNLTARGLDQQVLVVRAAVGQEDGTATLYSQRFGNRGDQRMYGAAVDDMPKNAAVAQERIPVVRFDDHVKDWQRLDAIKMDVQGFEGHALLGMRRSRERFAAAVLLMEFEPSTLRRAGSDPHEVLEELRRYGSSVYEVDYRGNCLAFDEAQLLPYLEQTNRHVNIAVGRRERLDTFLAP